MVRLLLEAGANPKYSREGEGTALQIAAFEGHELIVKHLLEAKADVNLQCEGDFRGVRQPQKRIQFKLLANQLCYIDKVHYSRANGSVGAK